MDENIKSTLDFLLNPPAESASQPRQPEPEPLPPRNGGAYGSTLDFLLAPDRHNQELEQARATVARQPDTGVDIGSFVVKHSLPFISAGLKQQKVRDYAESVQRFNNRDATPEDMKRIAEFEHADQEAAKRSTLSAVGHGVAEIPAVLGEFALGGAAVKGLKLVRGTGMAAQALRGAVATPLVPSTYLEAGARNQLANPDQSTFQSYAPAVALAASQNAVLGQLQGLLSGAPISRAGRILGKTGIGMLESAGADVAATSLDRVTKAVTGKTLGLDTKWGLLGSVLRGDEGAKKQAIVQFATFSIFSAMHSGREIPHDVLSKAIEAGAKPEEIAVVGKKVSDAVQAGKDPATLFPPEDKTPLADLGRAYVDAVKSDPLAVPAPEASNPGRSAVPEPSERPPEAPAPDAKQEPKAAEPARMIDVRAEIDRQGGESDKAFDVIRGQMRQHLDAGGEVYFWHDSKAKKVTLDGDQVRDMRGAPVGMLPLAMGIKGMKYGVELRPAPEPKVDIPAQPLRGFEPGGPLEKYGMLAGKFGDSTVHVIAAPENPKVAFLTGLQGKNFAAAVPELTRALHEQGFEEVQYRFDNADGRGAARARLLEPLLKKINDGLTAAAARFHPRGIGAAHWREQQRIAREQRAAEAEAARDKRPIEVRRKEYLDRARLKLATGTSAGDNWTAREAQAKVDGIRTFGAELRGRLDPEALSPDEMRILAETTGVKDPRRLPIFAEKGKPGRDLEQLAQELGLGDGEHLLDKILNNAPIEAGDKAFARVEAEKLAKDQADEEQRRATLAPEERAKLDAVDKEAAIKRYTEPFDWEDAGDASSVGERVWKFADDMEQAAKKEIEEKLGRGEVPFAGFDPTLIAPMAKLLAAKLIKGGVSFADYSASLVKRFGDSVKPHMQAIWDQAHAISANRKNLMDRMRQAQPEETPVPEPAKIGERGLDALPDVEPVPPVAGTVESLGVSLSRKATEATWLDTKQRERLLRYLANPDLDTVGEEIGLTKEGVRQSALKAFAQLKDRVPEFSAYEKLNDLIEAVVQDNELHRLEHIEKGPPSEAAARAIDVKGVDPDVNMRVKVKLSAARLRHEQEVSTYNEAVDKLVKLAENGKEPTAELRRILNLEGEDALDQGTGGRAAGAEVPAPPKRKAYRGTLFDRAGNAKEVPPAPDAAATPGEKAAGTEAPAPQQEPPAVDAQSLRVSENPFHKPKFSLFDFLEGESGHYWFPSGQLIADLAKRATRAIFGKGRVNDPNFKSDPDTNPDMPLVQLPHRALRKTAYNQLGANNSTPEAVATTTWMYSSDVDRNLANHLELRLAGRENPFKRADGTMEPDWQDKIEAEIASPGSQGFDAKQKAFVDDFWLPLLEKVHGWFEAEGIKFHDDDGNVKTKGQMLKEGYFHRGVADNRTDAEKNATPPGTRKPGFKPGYKKSRNEATLGENEAAGVEYMGPYESAVDFVREAYREITDKRFQEDALLRGEDLVPKFVGRAMAEARPWLDQLPPKDREAAERQIVRTASQMAQGNIRHVPAMKGKQYGDAAVAQVGAMFGERSGPILKKAAVINNEVRNFTLGADVSYMFLQTLPAAFTNFARWSRSMAKIPRAFVDGNLVANFLKQRPDLQPVAKLLVQGGGTLGQPGEGTLRKGKSVISKLPYVGKVFDSVYGRASQAMSQILDVVKLELLQANMPKDLKDLPRTIEALELSLGQGRMEKLGMTPERAFIERIGLLAPSFYRAHVGAMRMAMTRGHAGFVARKQLAGLAAGVMGTAIAGLYALKSMGEISDEEMEERLNPARGKFLMVPVPLAGGKKMEVGFGGIYVSIARTIGNAKRYAEGQTDENPASRWYRGHAGSLVRSAWDIGSGSDFLGKPTGPLEVAAKVISPVSLQAGFTGEGNVVQRLAGVATSATGLRSYAGTDEAADLDRVRKAAEREYGKRYEDLSYPEQAKLVRAFGPEKQPASPAAIERAMKNDQLRAQRLRGMVSSGTRDTLEEFKVAVPSYDARVSIGGTSVPLTKSRQDHYEQLLAEEYDRAVASWPAQRLREAPTKAREDFIKRSFEAAKMRAKARLVRG